MKQIKSIGVIISVVGFIISIILLVGALKFFRTMKQLTNANPSVVAQRDTLKTNQNLDTLIEINASLNQAISAKLQLPEEKDKEQMQILLYETINTFILTLDSIQSTNLTIEERRIRLKNLVNKTNLGCRAALFDQKDVDKMDALNIFMILDDKKLKNTIFECFSEEEIQGNCYDLIKHQAYYLEKIILEKNFSQLKT